MPQIHTKPPCILRRATSPIGSQARPWAGSWAALAAEDGESSTSAAGARQGLRSCWECHRNSAGNRTIHALHHCNNKTEISVTHHHAGRVWFILSLSTEQHKFTYIRYHGHNLHLGVPAPTCVLLSPGILRNSAFGWHHHFSPVQVTARWKGTAHSSVTDELSSGGRAPFPLSSTTKTH